MIDTNDIVLAVFAILIAVTSVAYAVHVGNDEAKQTPVCCLRHQ
jgi:hypothetical protein